MSSQFIMPAMPDQKIVRKEGESLLNRSNDYKITSEDSYIASWSLVEAHDKAIARIGEIFDPFVSGLFKLHKMAVELRSGFVQPLIASKSALLVKRQDYSREQERIKRLADEAAAEKLRAAQAKELEKQAKRLEKTGDADSAAVLREEAKTLPTPKLPPTAAVPKQAGSVVKTRWLFEITDPEKVDRLYCSPDEKKIRKIVDALGDKAPIEGIRIWKETKEHSRSSS